MFASLVRRAEEFIEVRASFLDTSLDFCRIIACDSIADRGWRITRV